MLNMKQKKNNSNIGIIGYGEVGKGIAKFYSSPRIKDLKRDDGLEGVEILHICFPWSNNVVKTVKSEIEKIKPKLTIIHSTVPLGTTKKIGGLAVHSPIRGVHPYLYESIKIFVKYIGADDKKAGKLAQKHLDILGIKTKLFMPSATTEALKLWDTTQYGWMIILNKEIKKWCDKNNLDFNSIYTEANASYNEGYKKMGRFEVLRPFLKYIKGEIGGHCVIPNCHLLDSEIAKFILEKNKKYL